MDNNLSINNYPLTDEQCKIVKAAKDNQSIKVLAFAGTGKTSTLQAIAKYHVRKSLYLCFNRALANDARGKFPDYVSVRTAHSLAWENVVKPNKAKWSRKLDAKLKSDDIKHFAGFPEKLSFPFSTGVLITATRKIVAEYFGSADSALSEKHITAETIEFADKLVRSGQLENSIRNSLVQWLVVCSENLAQEMLSADSECPSTHDAYLKVWQLSNPDLCADCIFFDEAQDANGVLLDVVLKQQAQIIFVGDPHQSIYKFRGAINAIDRIDLPELHLTQSFRYGNSIASFANLILRLKGYKASIKGFQETTIKSTNEYAGEKPLLVICRTNMTVLQYALQCCDSGLSVSIAGGISTFINLLESALSIYDDKQSTSGSLHPTLRSFRSWNEIITESEITSDPDLSRLVKLFSEGRENVCSIISRLKTAAEDSKDTAEISLVTAHGSKGIESDNVLIADDFDRLIQSLEDNDVIDEEEINLFYVAITRAKKLLLVPPVYRKLKGAAPLRVRSTPETGQLQAFNQKAPIPLSQPSNVQAAKRCIQIEVGSSSAGKHYWEPTNTSVCVNPNIGVLGTMGTGKTQCVQSLLYQLYQQQRFNVDPDTPIGMLIIDYKDDYTSDKFITATNATVCRPYHLPFNPFSLTGDMQDPQLPLYTGVTFVKTLVTAYGLGKKQEKLLLDCVLEAYRFNGIEVGQPETFHLDPPTVHDVWDALNSIPKRPKDSLYAALSDIITYQFFSPETRSGSIYELLTGVVVMDVKKLSGNIQKLFVALVLDNLFSQMQVHGKPSINGDHRRINKLLLVDEADNIMRPGFDSLRRLLKEGREYGVAVMLSTQDISHFQTTHTDFTPLMNTWVIHRVANLSAKDIRTLFNTSSKSDDDTTMSTIRNLGKHCSLYIDGQKNIAEIADLPFWKITKNMDAQRRDSNTF
ncbi:hypothetical protein GCM10023116_15010 [Kistimonas scapharcae]|uniref:DNA 3'-5' helicase n=1 Tax=Kistimonas scapharcae TaxID=1036133 RepID=A0ABP8V013_9GAMM